MSCDEIIHTPSVKENKNNSDNNPKNIANQENEYTTARCIYVAQIYAS